MLYTATLKRYNIDRAERYDSEVTDEQRKAGAKKLEAHIECFGDERTLLMLKAQLDIWLLNQLPAEPDEQRG